MSMNRIYLDNNATTRQAPEVIKAMQPFLDDLYGNPSSLHSFGTDVHRQLHSSVDALYSCLGATDDDDVLVTSCGTESNNTVIMSAYYNLIKTGEKSNIITSSVEHPAILATCRFLESLGVQVIYLPVDENGLVHIEDLKNTISDKTALVSIMWVNNETGMIFPVIDMARIAHDHGALFHTDAVQAIGKIHIDLKYTDIDYLSLSAHKFHGPKGVGALYVRSGAPLTPLLHGGEQMGGKRAGTLNVAGIVGMAKAIGLANKDLANEIHKMTSLRDTLEKELLKIPDTFVVGDPKDRIANTILISVKGVEGEAMLWDLNKAGIAASTGSACASEDLEANPILSEIGADIELAHTAIRLSLSRYTTKEQIERVIDIFPKAVKRLREISSSYAKQG